LIRAKISTNAKIAKTGSKPAYKLIGKKRKIYKEILILADRAKLKV